MTAELTTQELHRLQQDGSRWLEDARARLRLRLSVPLVDREESGDD